MELLSGWEPCDTLVPSESKLNDNMDAAFCSQCQSYTVIFDMVSNEFVCSSCGCVVADGLLSSEHAGSFPKIGLQRQGKDGHA